MMNRCRPTVRIVRPVCMTLALSLLLFFGCHRDQPPSPDDPYRDVPVRDRESLRTAVQQFVGFQKTHNWEKMYEVLQAPTEEKEKFLRRRAAATANLIEFSPASAAWIPEFWTITGCGVYEFATGGPSKALISSTSAKLGPKGWTFAPIGIDVFPEEPDHVKSCSPPAR